MWALIDSYQPQWVELQQEVHDQNNNIATWSSRCKQTAVNTSNMAADVRKSAVYAPWWRISSF